MRLRSTEKSTPAFDHTKAVIFDMDGLLLDTERLFKEAYQMAANEFGIAFEEDTYLRMIGHRADASQAILRDSLPPNAPVDELIDAARRYYYTLIEKGGVPLRPGVIEVLDYFDAREMPMAVATSTHRDLALAKLKSVHLLNRFTAVVSGDEVERGKPDPDIYLEAGRLLGADPEHCIVLEDSLTGLKAAHAAGMIVIHIPDLLPADGKTGRFSQAVYNCLDDFLAAYRAATEEA